MKSKKAYVVKAIKSHDGKEFLKGEYCTDNSFFSNICMALFYDYKRDAAVDKELTEEEYKCPGYFKVVKVEIRELG